MRLTTRLAATTLTATALLGLGAAAAAAQPAGDTATSDCRFGEHLVALWLDLPENLRTDLRELRDLKPGERAPFAREIRQGALDGEYGQGVQDRVERRIAVWASIPDELRSDLLALRDLTPGERGEAARAIGDDALAGEYGPKVQRVAEGIRSSDRWQECVGE